MEWRKMHKTKSPKAKAKHVAKKKAKAKGKVQAKAKAKAQPTLHVRGNATSSNVCVILTSEGGLWGVGHPNTTQPFI